MLTDSLPPFRLRTFGGLQLVRGDGAVPLGAPRRKPLALLALLAAHGDRGAERTWVASMLWPDLDETRARRTLAQTLYALRGELGSAEAVRGGTRLTVAPNVIGSDIAEFEACVLRARESGADVTHAEQRLETAISLFGGDFLEGVCYPGCVDFDHWCDTIRARLRRDYIGALRQLGVWAAERGDLARRITLLERCVLAAPDDSTIARALAECFASAGRIEEAVSVIEQHATHVSQALEIAAPVELLALARDWRHAAVTAATHRREAGVEALARMGADESRPSTSTAHTPTPESAPAPEPAPAPALARGTWSRAPTRRRLRHAGMLALALTLPAAAGLWMTPRPATRDAIPDSWDDLAAKDRATHVRRVGDTSRIGRIVILPVANMTDRPALDTLGTRIETTLREMFQRELTRPVLRSRTASELAAIRASRMPTTSRVEIGALMRRLGAPVAVQVALYQRGDTLTSITTYYRESSPPSEPGPLVRWWHILHRRPAPPTPAGDGRAPDILSMTPLGTSVVGQLHALHIRSVAGVLRSTRFMETCPRIHHSLANSTGWCWTTPGRIDVVHVPFDRAQADSVRRVRRERAIDSAFRVR